MDVETAIRLGHATAATSVRGIGTSDTVESYKRCLEIADEWGWRDAVRISYFSKLKQMLFSLSVLMLGNLRCLLELI